MSLIDNIARLQSEFVILKQFFNIDSPQLQLAFNSFNTLYNSTEHVDSIQFEDSINLIESILEDVCISNRISQETLESLM